uniref:Mitochondrial inner membrane protease subunit n=1 Tax=Amblyomma triste TaxID=251400 RepID=A0A023GMJ3_AMBTT
MTLFRNILSRCLRLSGFVIQSAAAAYCVIEFCGDLVICSGPSMEPTIQSFDILISDHISVHTNGIRRGDIVTAKNPINPKQYICKRVVAVHGDQLISGSLVLKIPKGHVWLEGDNKDNSVDSRSYGPVPLGLIRGRALCRIYPYHRATFFRNESKPYAQ